MENGVYTAFMNDNALQPNAQVAQKNISVYLHITFGTGKFSSLLPRSQSLLTLQHQHPSSNIMESVDIWFLACVIQLLAIILVRIYILLMQADLPARSTITVSSRAFTRSIVK